MKRTCNITVKYHDDIAGFIERFEHYLERKKEEFPLKQGLGKTYVLRTGVELTYRMRDGEVNIRATGPENALEEGIESMKYHYAGDIEVDYEIPVSKTRIGWGI